MKIDINKMQIAMANACMDATDLRKTAAIPEGTYGNIVKGYNLRPSTVGKVARTLGVPAEAILMDEETDQQQKNNIKIAETMEKARLVSRYTWMSMKFMQLYRMRDELTPDQQQEMAAVQKELEELDKILGEGKG